MLRQMIEFCLDIIVCPIETNDRNLFVHYCLSIRCGPGVLWYLQSDIFIRKFYCLSSSILTLRNFSRKTCSLSSLCIFKEIKDRGQMLWQMIEICFDIIVCPLDVILCFCGTYRVIFVWEKLIVCPVTFWLWVLHLEKHVLRVLYVFL
jgi:hypothetical protein